MKDRGSCDLYMSPHFHFMIVIITKFKQAAAYRKTIENIRWPEMHVQLADLDEKMVISL